jgi:hypothetical protein
MAKEFKSFNKSKASEKKKLKKISLYPLDLATALGAALATGPITHPESNEQKEAKKGTSKKR